MCIRDSLVGDLVLQPPAAARRVLDDAERVAQADVHAGGLALLRLEGLDVYKRQIIHLARLARLAYMRQTVVSPSTIEGCPLAGLYVRDKGEVADRMGELRKPLQLLP